MNGTTIGWAMGALAGLALIAIGYAVVFWGFGDCDPNGTGQ